MTPHKPFATHEHTAELCVVGGGMSGLATAVAAARHGARVALLHDRPVLGGNASSECRVHICGADRHNALPHLRETGILEELRMLNLHRNPHSNFTIWDTLLYEMVKNEPRLDLLLNCTCNEASMDGARIVSVTGWQLTTQCYHRVNARWFVDCSGDGILAPLTGAEFRMGREGRAEFGEPQAPEAPDRKTMGHSIRYALKRYDTPQTFVPPDWAYRFDSCDDLPRGLDGHSGNLIGTGYWWIELGGEHDSIADSEYLRDELLKIAYGVWDHVKNRCPRRHADASHLALDWLNFHTARRESRRFVGDHILTQNDLLDKGRFDDTVAYGGWTMDDHDPAGFYSGRARRRPTTHHACPSPYGIPWRSLYSKNIANLFFAGRTISATHLAMSSTRVMGTCIAMGQAVGAAAGLMLERDVDSPRDLLTQVGELQQRLLRDDCYLPGVALEVPEWVRSARLSSSHGNAEPVRDGWGRQIDETPHAWEAGPLDWVALEFDGPTEVSALSIAFDSAMHLDPQMSVSVHRTGHFLTQLPETLAQRFRVEVKRDGVWHTHSRVTDNIHRHVRMQVNSTVEGVRLTLERFHGNAESSRLYTFLPS